MGFLIILFNVACFVFLLVLLVRFVNAAEKMATSFECHERQLGRLATAVEQLAFAQSRAAAPDNQSHEG